MHKYNTSEYTTLRPISFLHFNTKMQGRQIRQLQQLYIVINKLSFINSVQAQNHTNINV